MQPPDPGAGGGAVTQLLCRNWDHSRLAARDGRRGGGIQPACRKSRLGTLFAAIANSTTPAVGSTAGSAVALGRSPGAGKLILRADVTVFPKRLRLRISALGPPLSSAPILLWLPGFLPMENPRPPEALAIPVDHAGEAEKAAIEASGWKIVRISA